MSFFSDVAYNVDIFNFFDEATYLCIYLSLSCRSACIFWRINVVIMERNRCFMLIHWYVYRSPVSTASLSWCFYEAGLAVIWARRAHCVARGPKPGQGGDEPPPNPLTLATDLNPLITSAKEIMFSPCVCLSVNRITQKLDDQIFAWGRDRGGGRGAMAPPIIWLGAIMYLAPPIFCTGI